MNNKTYRVVMAFNGETLSEFSVIAQNLKEAKQRAQFSKRCYCTYDKPASIPANRIKVTTTFAADNDEYDY